MNAPVPLTLNGNDYFLHPITPGALDELDSLLARRAFQRVLDASAGTGIPRSEVMEAAAAACLKIEAASIEGRKLLASRQGASMLVAALVKDAKGRPANPADCREAKDIQTVLETFQMSVIMSDADGKSGEGGEAATEGEPEAEGYSEAPAVD